MEPAIQFIQQISGKTYLSPNSPAKIVQSSFDNWFSCGCDCDIPESECILLQDKIRNSEITIREVINEVSAVHEKLEGWPPSRLEESFDYEMRGADENYISDFSSIERLHISKKNLRKILEERIKRQIKGYELDGILTISDLEKFIKENPADSRSSYDANQSSKHSQPDTAENAAQIADDDNNVGKAVESNGTKVKSKSAKKPVSRSGCEDAELYDSNKLEEIAKTYNREEEILVEEEAQQRNALKDASNREKSFKSELNALEVVEAPGEEPEYQNFIEKPMQYTANIVLVFLVPVFLWHCLIWVVKLLFDISWDTWGATKTVFYYGLAAEAVVWTVASLIYLLVHKFWSIRDQKYNIYVVTRDNLKQQLSKAKHDVKTANHKLSLISKNRENLLLHLFHTRAALPIRSLGNWIYDLARETYFDMLEKKRGIMSVVDSSERRSGILKFYDSKLQLFYNFSIPSEAPSAKVLEAFKKGLGRAGSQNGSREIVKYDLLSENAIGVLACNLKHFTDSSLDNHIDEFQTTLEMDTSGFFFKHDSNALEQQVNGMSRIFSNAQTVYNSFAKVAENANLALGLARMVAYKNIYLGVELLNVIRENAGGGKLSTASDSIETVGLSNISSLQTVEFSSSEALQDILDSSLSSALDVVSNVFENKKTMRLAAENPKYTAMAVAGAALFSAIDAGVKAWKQRNAKVESLINKQKQLIDAMSQLIDSYLDGYASTRRAMELTKALIKVNSGFEAVYKPLHDKVFIQKDMDAITMSELQQLALAIGEFKKISDSKL